jgi:hypothetical protein
MPSELEEAMRTVTLAALKMVKDIEEALPDDAKRELEAWAKEQEEEQLKRRNQMRERHESRRAELERLWNS